MAKRIVICADGTWNVPEQRDHIGPSATNVAKFAAAVAPGDATGKTQVVYYHRGVGVRGSLFERLSGFAVGAGLSANIEDTYLFLVNNYQPGDDLFLLGFSRGAYTVRSLAGLIRNSGILKQEFLSRYRAAYELYRARDPGTHPRAPAATEFRDRYAWPDATIRFVGVWDTVGALGIPIPALRFWNKSRYEFHDVALSTRVEHAYHALAIDERRQPYLPTLWAKQKDAPASQVLEQAWFPGTHCDVGGGYSRTGLSDGALTWLCERASRAGLAIEMSRIPKGDATAAIHDSDSLFKVFGDGTRTLGATNPAGFEVIHQSAVERRRRDASYGRGGLESFISLQPSPAVSEP